MKRKKINLDLVTKLKYRLLLIAITVFLAYFQTIFMYFWNDDNAIIFKLQHLSEGMGNLGSGIFGLDSPYRMVIFPLIPVYYFFAINSIAFFSYGLFFYTLAAVTMFVFAKSILKNQNQGLLVSLVFASSLVGAESLWRVYNSVHTSITIIYTLLFCIFYFLLIHKKKLRLKIIFYLIALFFFVLSIQWGFVRAHGIILIVIAIELLFNFNWKYSILRLVPFLYLFHKWYLTSSSNTLHFNSLISQIFYDYKFELLLVPLKTLENIFIPDIFKVPLWVFLILFSILMIKFRSKVLFFCLVLITSSYITYFVMYKDISLNTTHRYLTMALPGFSLLIVYVLSLIFKSQKKLYIASGIYIILNLVFLNLTHFKILNERSIPTKNFYQTLKSEIRTLNKNSIIYFDVEESDKSRNQFKDFFGVGSMPDTTAIAIHFNIDRYDFYMPQTFEEFIRLINENKIREENSYLFFYSSKGGLVNTSTSLRRGLFNEAAEFKLTDLDKINFDSSAPFKLSLNLNPKINEDKLKFKDSRVLENPQYINYLISKMNYYKTTQATSASEWKYQEIPLAIDNDLNTSWMSHRVHWHYNSHDEIIIDLKEMRKIGAVKLVFGPTDKTPIKFSYACSGDGQKWVPINFFYHTPRNHGEERIDKFQPIKCSSIKMELFDTLKKDAPIIREIEVIESDFTNLDFQIAKKIENRPFEYITRENYDDFYNYFLQVGLPINICPVTDKNNSNSGSCKKVHVKLNTDKVYSVNFDPQGTKLKQIKLDYPEEMELNLKNATFKYLPIEEVIY